MIDTDTRTAAHGVKNLGRRSARFTELKTLAERNGYQGFPGGYIKDMATGGTVAHGWSQFAERVLTGTVQLINKADLDRGQYASDRLAAPARVLAHRYAAAATECADRGDYERASAWLREAAAEVAKQDADDAREAYAHGGYGVPVTAAEIGAGYADWDSGEVPAHFAERCRVIGVARRQVIERLAELAEDATTAPTEAVELYATGEFGRALAWLTPAGLKASASRTRERADGLHPRATGYAQHGAPRADGSHSVWGLPYSTPAAVAENPGGEPVVDMDDFLAFVDSRSEDGWSLTPKGTAALKVAEGSVVRDDRPLCLRVDGAHVGHMAAVGDDCRTEIHQDPYDADAESRGNGF